MPTYPRRPAGKECSCGFLLARRARSGDVPAAPYRLTQSRYGEEVARAGRREDEGLPFLIAVRHRGPADRLQAFRRLLIRNLVGRRIRRGNPVRILVRHRNVRGRMGRRLPGRARRTPLGTDAPRRGGPALRTGQDLGDPGEEPALLPTPIGAPEPENRPKEGGFFPSGPDGGKAEPTRRAWAGLPDPGRPGRSRPVSSRSSRTLRRRTPCRCGACRPGRIPRC